METYHTYTFKVEEYFNNIILKDYLGKKGVSEKLLVRIKKQGTVFINDEKTPSPLFREIKADDTLLIDFGQEDIQPEPEDIPIDIIHEDNDLLIINKQPFLVVHPVFRHPDGTLANAIANHFLKTGVKSKVRFINRLDRNTSGIIMISKNIYAHDFIQKQLKGQRIKKTYWALVKGRLKYKEGRIEAPIGRDLETAITRRIMPDGQEAITDYKVLKEYEEMSLVELFPKTGRTHQLRVHMAYLGHPIIGDDLYNEEINSLINRQALHARKIRFNHPRTEKTVELIAELSQDIASLIK